MPLRPPAGFIRPGYDPLKVPDAPTGVSGTPANNAVNVAFTAPSNPGGSAITQYQVVAYTGGTYVSNTAGASSPITVSGLTNGTSYTFQVWALNTYGPGVWSAASGAVVPALLQRGIFAGGVDGSGSPLNVISYIDITTTGNATSFGGLYTSSYRSSACGSDSRGIIQAGVSDSTASVISYITFATTGNATSFGLLDYTSINAAACNSATRGLIAGGSQSGGYYNNISYLTIATTGNASNFGQMSVATSQFASCSSPTRGIFAAGATSGPLTSVINYVTIATTGNTTSFGNLVDLYAFSGASNSTRGIFVGGNSGTYVEKMEYITIATTGNYTNFGNVYSQRVWAASCAGTTRMVTGGGQTYGGTTQNNMEYVTIATTGNGTSFGTLTALQNSLCSTSSANGGVQ